MYVVGKIEVEESVSMLGLEEPEVRFSAAEFERYADIFEKMLERIEKEEAESGQDKQGWSIELNEFDMVEVAHMSERFGLTREY